MAIEIFIAIAILSAGASYMQAKKAQKKAKEMTEGVEANIESNSKEIPVIYGERRVGGVRVYIDTSRDVKHKYLYMVLAMAEGEVESITDIKIDDIPITDSRFRIGGIDNNPNIWYQVFTGTDTQTVSTLIREGVSYDNREDVWVDPYYSQHEHDVGIPEITYPWTVNHRLQGIAYLALKFKWDENAYQGIPDVTAVVKGKKVYDPRTQTTAWSDNPALCILDYLTNEKYGKGLSLNELDLDAFGQAATDCEDFTVTPFTGSTVTHQLFTMDAVIDTKNKIIENLNDMLIGCRGFLPFTQGKYRLIIDQPKNSVFTFTQDHIIDGISIKGSRKEDRFNQVKVNFFNKGQEYKEDQAIYPETNSTLYQQYLAEDQGEPLVEELDIFSFDNVYSAREMARLVLERSRKNLGIAFNATSEALVLDIGDVFAITHPTPAWTNKLFQVQELSFNYDGTVSVSAVEYDADLYTYDEPDEEQPYVGSRLPDTSEVDPVTNLAASSSSYVDADGKTIGYIDISWNAPSDELVDRYDIKLAYDGKEEVINTASTQYRYKPTRDNTNYTISVRAINGINIRSAWVSLQPLLSAKDTTAPSLPNSITAIGGIKHITLDWTNPTEDDFDTVEIYAHTTDIADLTTVADTATLIATVRVDNFQHDIGANDATRHYFLRSVDRTGNKSAFTDGVSGTTVKVAGGDISVTNLGDISTDLGTPSAGTIDGNNLTVQNLSASSINTGTLDANNVTISNLTIGYSSVTDTPTIPSNVSDLTNDTGFITSVAWGDITGTAPSVTTFGGAVEQSDIDASINNIKIGGRNLVSVISMDGTPTEGVYGGNKYARKLLRNSANYRIDNWDGTSTERPSGKYSLSFWAKANDSSDNPLISELPMSVDIGDQNSTNFTINSDWQYYKIEDANVTNYLGSPYYGFIDMYVSGNVVFYISNVKLEYGTKTTEWSPAPEDIENSQWWSLSGRANTNAPSNADFRAAFYRFPVTGDILLVTDTNGATANYQYNGSSWGAISALIRGDLVVSDSITATQINTDTVLTEALLANTADITGDLTVTSGKITVQDTDTVINLDPDAQYPFRISQGTEDVVRLGSSTLDPFIKGAFIRGMPVQSINEADLTTFVRNVVGVTSEEKTETETLTHLPTGGNLVYLENDNITTGLTTVITLESVAGTQSWVYEYADESDWDSGDSAFFNYTLQGYNGTAWEDISGWVNRPVFASGYRISGALVGWSISETYSRTIENNTYTHFRMVVGNMSGEFGGGLHPTSTGINCDFKLTSVTGSQVNSDNYADSFSINDTSGVLTIGRTGSLGDLTADISTYVGNQVSALVDSAPTTLDTLNELASALGDDPNFATTVTTSIGTKWTQDNTKIANWDSAYEDQHSWQWRWQRWQGTLQPSADTASAWQTYYETYFTKRTSSVDASYPFQDGGYVDTINNVDSTGGFGGSTYGNMFGNLSTYHCLIYTNIYVDKEFTVNITNFNGDDPHAIFVDGKFVHGRIPCCTDTSYSYTFTQGWHRIDLIYSEGGGGDWIRMGWNPKDYTANISDMVAHRGGENPVYLMDKIKLHDGVGSGLDADLLDGNQGSYYLDYNNFTNKPSTTNWDTAYGWGDHSTAGYLTSYTETDTLDSVTDRGASTTNGITVGSLTTGVNGNISTGTGGSISAFGNITAGNGYVQSGSGGFKVSGTQVISGSRELQNCTIAPYTSIHNNTQTSPSLHSTGLVETLHSHASVLQDSIQGNVALFKLPTIYGYNGTWNDLGQNSDVTNGRMFHNWGGLTLSRDYSEFIIYFGSQFGYSFINALTILHSTNGNSMQIIVETIESSGATDTGWNTHYTTSNVSSWPGSTVIRKNIAVGGGYDNLFRIRIIPNWTHASNAINIGQITATAGYGSASKLFEWDASKNLYLSGTVNTTVQGAAVVMSGSDSSEGIKMQSDSSTTYPVFLRSVNPSSGGENSPWIYKEQVTSWGIWHNNPSNTIDFTRSSVSGAIADNVGGGTNSVVIRLDMANGVVQSKGGYKVGNTTVIDSSRNLVDIGNITCGTVNAIEGNDLKMRAGTNEDIGDIVFEYNNGSEKHRLWDGGSDGLNYRYNGGTTYKIGVNTNTNSLAINNTTVIDASRNITNIGNATTSGTINVNRSSNGNSIVTKTGSIINFQVENYTTQTTIRSDTGTLYFWQPNSSYQMKLVNNGAVSLAYDGTWRLDTTSTGILATGHISRFSGQQNGESRLELYNNRQDLSNAPVYSLVGYNASESSKVTFYRGSGGSGAGYIRFATRSGNSASMQEVFQIGENSDAWGVNVLTGGYRVGGTTVIDSSRNLVNIANVSSTGGANKIAQYASNGYLYCNNWIHPADGTGIFYDNGTHLYSNGSGAMLLHRGSGSVYHNIRAENNNWKYVRLSGTSGVVRWDIASKEDDLSGALQFRPAGSSTNRAYLTTGGDFVISGNIQVTAKQLIGGIGAETTSGTTDWNHISNARSGNGYTLLLGTHTNGFNEGGYYHPFSFEYNNKDGNGNMTQFAVPYSGGSLWFRSRYSGYWDTWARVLDSRSAWKMGSTTVVDTNRNAIGFVDIKGSGSYHEFGNSIGSVSNDGNWNARLNLAGSSHARLDVKSVSDGIITSIYSHTGHAQGRIGTMSNHSLGLMTNGSVYASLSTGGVFNVFNGYQVNGTTVIDSSRNLTNINNITHTGNQYWNGHIYWGASKNIYVQSGECSFDVSTSAQWRVWDATNSIDAIKVTGGSQVEIGQAGNRGLKVFGTTNSTTGYQVNGTTMLDSSGARNLKSTNQSLSNALVAWNSHNDATNNFNTNWNYGIRVSHGDAMSYYSATIGIDFFSDTVRLRRMQNGVSQGWREFALHGKTVDFSSVQISGTTVIDSSRNLTNIGNINLVGTVEVTGGEGREIRTYMPSSYTTGSIVSGHEYGWYNDHWRTGMCRSGNTAGDDFGFDYNGSRKFAVTNTGGIEPSGEISMNASCSQFIKRARGVYLGWASGYGTQFNHSITSSDGGSYGDHITLNSYGNVRINFDSNSNGTNYFRIGHATTGTGNVLLTLDESGNATFAGNVTAYSDARLKENITPVDNSLDKVCSLNGVYYNMIDDESKKKRIGLIAQEVQKILPEVVVSAKPEDDKDDILSVDYGNITALLIEAIKEQQAQINELKEELKNVNSN